MNWFERYGIVGMSFFVFLGIFLFIGGSINIQYHTIEIFVKEYSYQVISGLVGFSFLPIGYIIMNISQNIIYYGICSKLGRGVHQRILEKFQELKNVTELTHKDREADVEMALTYIDRMRVEPFEKRRSLDTFITKRLDVIAINRGIITAFLFALITVFIIVKQLSIPSIICLILTCVILPIILFASNHTLEQQIIKLNEKIFFDLKRKIEISAYSIWEREGKLQGRALDNWLEAEREILFIC